MKVRTSKVMHTPHWFCLFVCMYVCMYVCLFVCLFHLGLLDFILEDFRTRFDIATAWLFAEYSIAEGYLQSNGQKDDDNYDKCLTGLMLGIKAKLNPRDRMFTKLVLEAPKMTPAALDIIKSYCHDEVVEPVYSGHPWDTTSWLLYTEVACLYSGTCI